MNRESCKGCIYQGTYFGHKGCNYILIMQQKRNCDPAHCTKKLTVKQQKEQEKEAKRLEKAAFIINYDLKQRIKELKITQAKLAEITEIPFHTFTAKINHLWKNGATLKFSKEEKTRIAEAVGLSVEVIQ